MFTLPFAFMAAPAGGASLPSGYTFYVDASDPASYPGTGTTWFDLSGNGYDMTLNSADVFVDNGGNDKYMDFESGIAKYLPGGTLTNIPTTDEEEGTWVFYTSVKNLSGGDFKTLLRGKLGNHPVIISDNGVSLGLYAADPYFAFDISTISNVDTQPHMMAWQLKVSTTPNWSFFYDSFTSSAQATINATPALDDGWASACLAAWHVDNSDPTSFAQTWGKIWFAVYYPFLLSTAELNQVNNYIASRYATSIDPDAQAFFDAITAAGGSLTATEENAINQLVLDLKSYGLWTKMIGLWPVVGTTSITQSFNLKDPTEYNLGFNGTWSHTSAGASPGAGYATTGIVPSVIDFATLGSIHYSLYITEDYPSGCYDMGAYTPSGGDFGMLSSCGNNTAYIGTGTGWLTVGNGGSTKQNWLMTNDGSTSYIYSNGSEIASDARTITTGPDVQIYISANNNNGGVFFDYSERSWALASIGLGMDATEAADYDTAVVTFQTTLGRQN